MSYLHRRVQMQAETFLLVRYADNRNLCHSKGIFFTKFFFEWVCVVLLVCRCSGNGKNLLQIALVMNFSLLHWTSRNDVVFRYNCSKKEIKY